VVLDRSAEGDFRQEKGRQQSQGHQDGAEENARSTPIERLHPDCGQHLVRERWRQLSASVSPWFWPGFKALRRRPRDDARVRRGRWKRPPGLLGVVRLRAVKAPKPLGVETSVTNCVDYRAAIRYPRGVAAKFWRENP
jgi:hypothetical protein